MADHFGMQYPKQTFIPRQQPLGYQLLPEQRLFLGVIGVMGVMAALALIGTALFLACVWIFVPAAH